MSIDSKLLPRDKHDTAAVARLATLAYPRIAPLLAELLSWLKDANWPVARPVAELFVSLGAPVVPLLLDVLEGDDEVWKYWCLTEIIYRLSPEVSAPMRAILERLAYCPSVTERSEEVDIVAKAILDECFVRHELVPLSTR